MQNPFENRGLGEGARLHPPQRKIGLETPLVGRFWGENKRLVFSPPNWYQGLVIGCFIVSLYVLFGRSVGWFRVPWFLSANWLGWAVLGAGVWALMSMEYAVFDLKSKTYFRREGGGIFKRTRRGSTTEIDAVVVYCSQYLHGMAGQNVVYRTVIHWKNARVPLLLTERQMSALPPGAPLNYAAGPILVRAQRYAEAMSVKYFDNTYFHSPTPQTPI